MSFSSLTRLDPWLRFPSYGRPRPGYRNASLRVYVQDVDRSTLVSSIQARSASVTLSQDDMRDYVRTAISGIYGSIDEVDRPYYPTSLASWIAVAATVNYSGCYNGILPSYGHYSTYVSFSKSSKSISVRPTVGAPTLTWSRDLAETYWDFCRFEHPFNAASAALEWSSAPWSMSLAEGTPEIIAPFDVSLKKLPMDGYLSDL